jgi:CBS domain containing-hemolysin-like protein
MSAVLPLCLALLLVALNAFFVLAEFAIIKVRATRVDELAREGSLKARWTRRVLQRLDSNLSATQVGITMASLGLGWVGEPALAHLLEAPLAGAGDISPVLAHTLAVAFSFLAITFVHVVFGELAPKSIAIRRPEQMALASAGPLQLFSFVFYPLIWIFERSASVVLALIGLSPALPEEMAHSEEELRALLSRSGAQGKLGNLRPELIENLLEFPNLATRQIMVPRTDVVFLSIDAPLAETLRIAQESGHTRFPVCRGGLDQVLGIVHIKSIFNRAVPAGGLDLASVLGEALFVPETMPADRLLRTFQRRRQHMAIVVDEYGGSSGIVTLEDVIEEIVGEVQDEFDQENPDLAQSGDGVWTMDGRARLEEVADRLDGTLDEPPDVDTIGGYVQARLGRLARTGDVVPLGGWDLKVTEARGARVRRIEARRRPVEAAGE